MSWFILKQSLSFGKKLVNYIIFTEAGPEKMWVFFLSLEDNKEDRWNKSTRNMSLSYAMLSEYTDLY